MNDNLDYLWNETLNVLREHINVPTFKTWFENTAPVSFNDDTLVVSTPSNYAREWLESRHTSLLKDILFKVSGKDLNIKFAVVAAKPDDSQGRIQAESRPSNVRISSPTDTPKDDLFSSRYTFDNFVIGSSNRFAHAAALSVSEKPSRAYNPLFIYGGVGLGKTHLMQATGHYIRNHYPHLKVKYVSSEKFMNDFISSIMQKDRISGFQKKYRYNDVLLIDDIQFLEKKEATQEEFFHTFNSLYEADKQIIITSDRPPKELKTLELRLRSRFEWGLITDIQPPELETRIAILRSKALQENLRIDDEILEFVAISVSSNVRELEGVLTRIVAFSSLTRTPIDLSTAKEVLKDVIPRENSAPICIELIQQEICRYFKISLDQLLSEKRSNDISFPRQIGMYLTRDMTDLSLPKIGECFGGRDHSTVLYAINKISDQMKKNKDTYQMIKEVSNKIKIRSS